MIQLNFLHAINWQDTVNHHFFALLFVTEVGILFEGWNLTKQYVHKLFRFPAFLIVFGPLTYYAEDLIIKLGTITGAL